MNMLSNPLTAQSRKLIRFTRHLPVETMTEDFAGDYAFLDAGSRYRAHAGRHA
jgi:hypothetical protein